MAEKNEDKRLIDRDVRQGRRPAPDTADLPDLADRVYAATPEDLDKLADELAAESERRHAKIESQLAEEPAVRTVVGPVTPLNPADI